MGTFVEVTGIPTNEEAIDAEGAAKMAELLEAAGIVGWKEREADLAVIVRKTVASMVPSVAQIAAVVPSAIFRKYGTELVNTPYNEGTAATVTTKWKLVEESGSFPPHTIEAGTQLTIGEQAFYVKENLAVLEGESEVNVVLVASERGAEFNGLTGVVELVDAISWVKEVTIVGETSGGVDQESDEEYENRLAASLKLQAPRPITAANFAEMARQIPLSLLPAGTVVGRSTAIDGYEKYAVALKIEGKPTSAKTDLKEVSSLVGMSFEKTSGAQIHPGSRLKWEAGAGVLPKGVTAKAKLGATEVELSVAAEKTEAKGKIEILDQYEVQRTVTVFVTDKTGKELGAEAMEAIQDYLEEFRELNFVVAVEAASYNEIRVTTQIHVLPGYVEASVIAAVKTTVEKYLSPETWGNPTSQESGAVSWLNATQAYNVVRYNSILGVIENVPGVQYVFPGSTGLAIGLAEAPGSKVSDLTLLGPAPLTEVKATNIKVTAA